MFEHVEYFKHVFNISEAKSVFSLFKPHLGNGARQDSHSPCSGDAQKPRTHTHFRLITFSTLL